MKYFLNTIKNICTHPITRKKKRRVLFDFLKWELSGRLVDFSFVYEFVNDSLLIAKRGMDGATGNLIFGLAEYNDMSFTLHYLREEDCFIDVGANVGVYTILASKAKGARTVAFEPIPSTYLHLMKNIALNEISSRVKAYNVGIGAQNATIRFTSYLDSVNHVISEGEMCRETLAVPIVRLDSIISPTKSCLIKIDVEGYERNVLEGAKGLIDNDNLKAIIIELNGSGKRYGCSDDEIHKSLLRHNFKPYSYNPLQREFSELKTFGEQNTIYLRDFRFVNKRVKEAEPFTINKFDIAI